VDAIARLAAEPRRAAVFLDIDGVLAPIVERPEDAIVPEETRDELARLRDGYGLVACVTGRPSADGERVVGVPGLRYVGEHGLELDPAAAGWRDRVRAFAATVAWPDTEEKPYSVAFHYRTAPDASAAVQHLEPAAAAARDAGLKPRWGRMVLEVLPPLPTSKGTAVRHLLRESGLACALYAGDDTTDLDGFAALDDLEVAVRVAVVSAEGPSELGDRADLLVRSTSEFLDVLRRL
jgi:trehalose 6-phosphate phosphatase